MNESPKAYRIGEISSPESDGGCLALLIDDQRIVAHGLVKAVENEKDIDVHYCSDAQEAVVTAIKIEPTVILLDLLMPSIDGMEVLSRIRNEPRIANTPVIMLSSEENADIKAQAFANGANDYITKWPATAELLARIRYHSRFYRNQQKLDAALESLRHSQKLLTEKNIELEQLSLQDALTGLANRRSFNVRFDEEVRRAAREKNSLALLFIDVDFFKKYNDLYGHLEGDECLRKVARVFLACARRPVDLCARYGGEEFVVVMPGADETGALVVAKNVLRVLQTQNLPHEASDISEFVTVSIGVVVAEPDQETRPEDLISSADEALYEAKRNGRNRFEIAATST